MHLPNLHVPLESEASKFGLDRIAKQKRLEKELKAGSKFESVYSVKPGHKAHFDLSKLFAVQVQ